jgi:hypothetical protein
VSEGGEQKTWLATKRNSARNGVVVVCRLLWLFVARNDKKNPLSSCALYAGRKVNMTEPAAFDRERNVLLVPAINVDYYAHLFRTQQGQDKNEKTFANCVKV